MNRRTALRTLAGAASLAPLAMLANESSAPSSAKNQEAIDPVAQPRLPRVCVHSDGHLLQLDDGRPFFWLGDTAWELIHRATRDECSYYLATRGRQGFTVIQTVVLAEFDGSSADLIFESTGVPAQPVAGAVKRQTQDGQSQTGCGHRPSHRGDR